MSKTKLPHFPLFFGDLLAATPRWKGPQRSLYVLLLAYQWFDGPIPTETAEIAEMCGYPLDEFERLWEIVGRKFVPVEGGLINLRCEEHREKAARISKKRSKAGKKGGQTTRQRVAAQRTQQEGQQTGQQTGEQTEQQTGVANMQQVATPFAGPSIPSHPIPSDSSPTARSAREREGTSLPPNAPDGDQRMTDAEMRAGFARCSKLYPPYTGRKNWIIAEQAARGLVTSGRATWDVMEQRTDGYAKFCEATGRPVMRPENFFTSANDPPCLQEWKIPEPAKSQPKQPSAVEKITWRPGSGEK